MDDFWIAPEEVLVGARDLIGINNTVEGRAVTDL